LEVERIVTCLWRLKRSWRYENAEIDAGVNYIEFCVLEPSVQDILASESRAVIPQLEVAKKEAEASGKIPQELVEKIFAASPRLKQVWPRLEEFMKKNYDEVFLDQCRKAGHPRYIQSFLLELPDTQEARARIVSIGITKLAIQCVQHNAKRDRMSWMLHMAGKQFQIRLSQPSSSIMRAPF
jgi:hypothetical protein